MPAKIETVFLLSVESTEIQTNTDETTVAGIVWDFLLSRRNVSTGEFLSMSAHSSYATCKSYAKEIHLHAVRFRLAMNPTKIRCQIPQK